MWSASEGGYAEPGERRRDAVVVTRRAIVVEREQRDELDTGGGQCGGAFEHLLLIAAFEQVADQDQDRVVRLPDQSLAIAERAVDVCAPAQLRAEEQFDRVGKFRR